MNPEEGASILYSTCRPHADLSLATVIHFLSCPVFPLLLSRAFLGYLCMCVVWSAEVSLLVVTLYTMRQAFASEILNRHLRVSINEYIVGDSATIPLTCSETSMGERFQFGSVCFFQCPAFASPECYTDNNRWIESATDIDRYLFVAEQLLVNEA
jgi:hypothetical protein